MLCFQKKNFIGQVSLPYIRQLLTLVAVLIRTLFQLESVLVSIHNFFQADLTGHYC